MISIFATLLESHNFVSDAIQLHDPLLGFLKLRFFILNLGLKLLILFQQSFYNLVSELLWVNLLKFCYIIIFSLIIWRITSLHILDNILLLCVLIRVLFIVVFFIIILFLLFTFFLLIDKVVIWILNVL